MANTVGRNDRPRVDPEDFPTTWFLGDSVISRRANGKQVRVFPCISSAGVHKYRVVLHEGLTSNRSIIDVKIRDTLIDALRLGEEWLP